MKKTKFKKFLQVPLKCKNRFKSVIDTVQFVCIRLLLNLVHSSDRQNSFKTSFTKLKIEVRKTKQIFDGHL